MQPEKIILLPPTHESLPTFHVQGELLPSFLDHLANSGIKVSEPPEPQGNLELGAISVVGWMSRKALLSKGFKRCLTNS
jgi:hypothetical protein